MTKFHGLTARSGVIACGILLALSLNTAAAESPEDRLAARGYEEISGKAPKPFGNYLNGRQVGSLVFVSSAAPQDVNGEFGKAGGFLKGRFGADLKADAKGAKWCELAAVRSLRFLRGVVGDLSRVKSVVKIDISVQSTPDFKNVTPISNGCSDFLVKIFGPEIGKHARVSASRTALPFGVALEVTGVYEVK